MKSPRELAAWRVSTETSSPVSPPTDSAAAVAKAAAEAACISAGLVGASSESHGAHPAYARLAEERLKASTTRIVTLESDLQLLRKQVVLYRVPM